MSDDNDDQRRESLFGIMDDIMLQMSKTKKMFLVMVLTVMILPPIGLLVMTSVFDSPFYPTRDGRMIHDEWEENSHHLRDMLLTLEKLPPELRAEKLEEILASDEYAETSSKIQVLSEEHPEFEKSPSTDRPPVKPLQLIIFVISGTWLGIGIRQWYIMSKWDSKYKQFRKQQEEIDRKIDEEQEEQF